MDLAVGLGSQDAHECSNTSRLSFGSGGQAQGGRHVYSQGRLHLVQRGTPGHLHVSAVFNIVDPLLAPPDQQVQLNT